MLEAEEFAADDELLANRLGRRSLRASASGCRGGVPDNYGARPVRYSCDRYRYGRGHAAHNRDIYFSILNGCRTFGGSPIIAASGVPLEAVAWRQAIEVLMSRIEVPDM
jgi:hypothetical protein